MAEDVFKNKLFQSQSWHVWGNLDKNDPQLFKIEICENQMTESVHTLKMLLR